MESMYIYATPRQVAQWQQDQKDAASSVKPTATRELDVTCTCTKTDKQAQGNKSTVTV